MHMYCVSLGLNLLELVVLEPQARSLNRPRTHEKEYSTSPVGEENEQCLYRSERGERSGARNYT